MYSTFYSNPQSLIGTDVATIAAAAKTLDIAAYTLTEPTIINAIVALSKRNIPVRLYLDRTELEAEARGNPALPNSPLHLLINIPNVTVKVKCSSILMHLKSYCVDGALLRDGSANFSPIGETEQDNSLTLTDDPAAVGSFQAKFASMWARSDNLSIAMAIQSTTRTSVHPVHRQH